MIDNYVILTKAKVKVKVPIRFKTGKMTMGYRYKGREKPEEQQSSREEMLYNEEKYRS